MRNTITPHKNKRLKIAVKLLLCAILTVVLTYTAFAQSTAQFSVTADNADENRLFYLHTLAQSDNEKLGAVRLMYVFDENFLEFKSVKAFGGGQVKSKCENGTLTVIYLNTAGADIDDKSSLFSINFKALNSGNTDIYLYADQCINTDAQTLSANEISYSLSVNQNGAVSVTKSDKKLSRSEKAKLSKSSSKLTVPEVEGAELENQEGNYEKLDVDDSTDVWQIVKDCVLVVVLAILIFVLAFRIASRRNKKKNAKNPNLENDSDED